MPYNDGIVTFMAGVDLAAHRRVKIDTSGTQSPIDVIYADAGEGFIGVTEHAALDGYPIAVKLITWGGSLEIEAADTWAVGATIYGADDGKASDTSSGSAFGIAKTACETAAEIIEILPYPVLSTTAGTVSILDSGEFTDTATIEAALAEIYQDLLSAQCFIPLSLMSFREATNFDVGAITANGGVLASDTTPALSAINDATDGCQRIAWAASNNDQIITQVPLPPDIDVTADLVLHVRIASEGTTNAVGFTVASYFNEADTAISDTTGTNQTATYAEKTATIAAADVPAGAQTLTIGLTPVAHTTDAMYMTAAWLEYTRSIRTS